VGTRLWRKDLAWGERWERVIGLYLFFNGVSNITYNNDNRYDIKGVYKSNVTKFEIKSDRYKNTGNMALEINDNDKPSGISVSEADIFVYNYTNISDIYVYIFFIPLVELKKVLRDNQSKLKIIKGGDDKEASIILLPMAEYKKYFKVVKLPKVEWYM
jgi:penicillin-binding protein-related factor A (putative recombinase)